MKTTLFMATSANGMIATPDGSEDFLSHDNWIQFTKLLNKAGNLIWGKKTHEAVMRWPKEYLGSIKTIDKVILSHSKIELEEGFRWAQSPEQALSLLQKAGFSEVIITGGSTINSEFAKLNLIDEVILDINPSLVGSGIPLFSPSDFLLNLQLIEFKKIADSILEIKYQVIKN